MSRIIYIKRVMVTIHESNGFCFRPLTCHLNSSQKQPEPVLLSSAIFFCKITPVWPPCFPYTVSKQNLAWTVYQSVFQLLHKYSSNLKEYLFILVHTGRGVNPCSAASKAEASWQKLIRQSCSFHGSHAANQWNTSREERGRDHVSDDPTQTYTEVCFTNHPGASQANELPNPAN